MKKVDSYRELTKRIRGFALEDGVVTRIRVHSKDTDRDTIVSSIKWTVQNAAGVDVEHKVTFFGSALVTVTVGFVGVPTHSLNINHFYGSFTRDAFNHILSFDIIDDLSQYL